jgi:hypothetical protein
MLSLAAASQLLRGSCTVSCFIGTSILVAIAKRAVANKDLAHWRFIAVPIAHCGVTTISPSLCNNLSNAAVSSTVMRDFISRSSAILITRSNFRCKYPSPSLAPRSPQPPRFYSVLPRSPLRAPMKPRCIVTVSTRVRVSPRARARRIPAKAKTPARARGSRK